MRRPLVDSAQSLCLRALAAAEASMASCVRADEFRRLNEQFDALLELDDDRVATCAFVVRHLHSGGNPHEAVWAAQRAYESQDQLAQESMVFQSYTVDVEAKLLTFPAVQAELQSQRNDIEDLTARPSNLMAIVSRAKTNRT